jgi:hypothetical protein
MLRLKAAAFLALAMLMPLTQVANSESAKPKLTVAGTIQIDQTQVALLVSGTSGGGTLTFKGKRHGFSIGGLGIGGIGITEMKASGTVYNMTSLDQFAGAYGQARWGITAGNAGKGDLWLEKTDGTVVIRLRSTERKGLALSLGADVVKISLK